MTVDETDSSGPYEFDLAVSFAGEDRQYVESVVRAMQDLDLNVFYDHDQMAQMWGEELPEFFEKVYSERTQYVLMFVSQHYAHKVWAIHERRVALGKALEMRRSYVLPVRLDDTKLDGLRGTVGYIDSRVVGQAAIIAAARQKVRPGTAATPPPVTRVPKSQLEVDRLIREKTRIWEYLLFGGYLHLGLQSRADAYRSHLMEIAPRNGELLDDEAVMLIMHRGVSSLMEIIHNLNRVLQPGPQELAFGPRGQAGDAEAIRHLAMTFLSLYDEILQWAQYRRGVTAPNGGIRAILDVQAKFADQPLAEIHRFVRDYVDTIDHLIEKLDAGESPSVLDMTLTVTLPEPVRDEHSRLIDMYRDGWRGDDE